MEIICKLVLELCVLVFIQVYTTSCYELQLSDGPGSWQGKIKVSRTQGPTAYWGSVCDQDFGVAEAAVVCRQLNYTYSKVDSNTYSPELQGVYVLDAVQCQGDEKNIEDCKHSQWNTHNCHFGKHYAAGVCCSNSPTFGEQKDNVFISHCGTSWLEAEESCEQMGATLISSIDYFTDSSTFAPSLIQTTDSWFWAGSFFTPWIWSNGCVTINDDTLIRYTVTIDTNSPQKCLQHCTIYGDIFLLSESMCACMNSSDVDAALTTVMPSHCKILCPDDRYRFCGTGNGAYWNMYKQTTEDIFFRISGPDSHDINQCAVIVANKIGSKNLQSEPCAANNGYICHKYSDSSQDGILFFNDQNDLTGVQTARLKCPSKDGHLQLVGDSILQQDRLYFEYNGLWVDLSRVLTHVQPGISSTAKWRKLVPQWCYSYTLSGTNKITDCASRFLYTCKTNKMTDPGKASGSTSAPPDGSNVSSQEILHLILITCCSIGVSLLIIVLLICWIKRRSQNRSLCCCLPSRTTSRRRRQAPGGTGDNDYSATFQAVDKEDHNYEDVKTCSENIYHEINTPLMDSYPNETDVQNGGMKEPVSKTSSVSMPRNYSDPKDMLEFKKEPVAKTHSNANYVYPFDKIYRREDNADKIYRREDDADLVSGPDTLINDGYEVPATAGKHQTSSDQTSTCPLHTSVGNCHHIVNPSYDVNITSDASPLSDRQRVDAVKHNNEKSIVDNIGAMQPSDNHPRPGNCTNNPTTQGNGDRVNNVYLELESRSDTAHGAGSEESDPLVTHKYENTDLVKSRVSSKVVAPETRMSAS